MDTGILKENQASRQRLAGLVERLTDDDLSRPLEEGWTAAAILAHLAFWDYRALGLIRRWKESGIGPSPIDIDNVNGAMLPLLLAIPPRLAAGLALSAAEAIDRELESAPPELIAGIQALGGKFRLRRCEHRLEHIEQIERTMAQFLLDSPLAGSELTLERDKGLPQDIGIET